MARCELPEARDDMADTPGTRVRKRAATEGCEARPEEHRSVDKIGGVHDTFSQTRDALVDHHEYQAIGEIGWRARPLGRWLDGLALVPQVETLATLAAE